MPKECANCHQQFGRRSYSKSQWEKSSANRKCKFCTQQTQQSKHSASSSVTAGTTVEFPEPPFPAKVLVMSGPPASGKGTICKKLSRKYGLIHISTGDIFRAELDKGTQLGAQASEAISQGCFVHDDVVIAHVLDRISKPDCVKNGCILDGFPRTTEQAEKLLQKAAVDRTLVLDCPDRVLIKRAPGRRIDPITGEIYHKEFIPPPAAVVPRLVKRNMDNDIRTRLDVFRAQLRRIALPKVANINANKSPGEIFEDVCRILDADIATGAEKQLPQPPPVALNETVSTCTVCLSEPADFLCVPCGHQCACEGCLNCIQASGGSCPICRTPIQSICKVFSAGRTENEHSLLQRVTQLGSKAEEVHCVLADSSTPNDDDDSGWPEDIDDQTLSTNREISLNIAPVQNVPEQGGIVDVVVTVNVQETTRNPVDVCVVIDVSGSMGTAATVENDDGTKKDTGLSVLDIVKHSVKTVVKCLDAGDRLSIVAYSSDASTPLPLTTMSEDGQGKALSAVESLRAVGSTNMWAGILAGMDNLRSGNMERDSVLMLLTDGCPTVNPPNGYLFEMNKYKDSYPGFNFQLNSFGFGYNLKSELLHGLSQAGNGTYAFIPDAVIVGTTFVNSVSNILSVSKQNSTLHLSEMNGATFHSQTFGNHEESAESWGRVISFGPLNQGQARSISVRMFVPGGMKQQSYLAATLEVAGSDEKISAEGSSKSASAEARHGHFVAKMVSVGTEAIDLAVRGQGNRAMCKIKELKDEVKQVQQVNLQDLKMKALYADIEGRMTKAFNGQARFKRWGMHYLRALIRAHQLQCCTNFMDPGLQVYGGELFRSLRTKGDQLFLALPPPTTSRNQQYSNSSNIASQSTTCAVNMNTYYAGSGGGCFAPWSKVEVAYKEGSTNVPCCEVRKGDVVKTKNGWSTVICAVHIARSETRRLIHLTSSGLYITGGHPIRRSLKWCIPRDEKDAHRAKRPAKFVVNFVLDTDHVIIVEGEECITWGHGFEDDCVKHPFYGTESVIKKLKEMPGWDTGIVHVDERHSLI